MDSLKKALYGSNAVVSTRNTVPQSSRTQPGNFASWNQSPGLDIQTVTLQNLYPGIDVDELPMFREEAQTVPGVMAAANFLTSAIGTLPIIAVDSTGKKLPVQPAWTARSDSSSQSPYIRQVRTVLDILFNGQSLWSIDAKGVDGYPLSMSNVWHQHWNYDPQSGIVYVNGQPSDPASFVLMQGAFPGLLNVGGRTLRAARDIERTVRARARISMPVQVLQNMDTAGQSEPTKEELEAMLAAYAENRRNRDGAVAYVPGQYKLKVLEESDSNWLLEARNAVIGDIAKLTGIPAGLLEGENSSMNYTTELGQLARAIDVNLKNFIDPITARLSMGDVTPRGTSVQFDLSELQTEEPAPLTDKGQPVAPDPAAKEPSNA